MKTVIKIIFRETPVLKKIISVLILLTIISAFAGCTGRLRPKQDSGKISVIATVFPPYDFAREIIGGEEELKMLLPPGAESHSYEPTLQDIMAVRSCDVFIYVGGESDAWVRKILDSVDITDIKIITLIDCVELAEEKIVEGMEAEGDGDEPEYDEHVWTSPKNVKLIVQKISVAMCEADPDNAAFYKKNTEEYLLKLDELDVEFQSVADNAACRTLIFGDRFPFRYFADAYGLTYFAAFPGCSSETEASPKTIAFLIEKVRAEDISAVFYIELSNEKTANTICAETGAKKLLLHSCHNVTRDEFKNGITYLELMQRNVEALKEALN